MSKYTITLETENVEELLDFSRASPRAALVFELQHNFWRHWKHSDLTQEQDEMLNEVLNKLYDLIKEYEDD